MQAIHYFQKFSLTLPVIFLCSFKDFVSFFFSEKRPMHPSIGVFRCASGIHDCGPSLVIMPVLVGVETLVDGRIPS